MVDCCDAERMGEMNISNINSAAPAMNVNAVNLRSMVSVQVLDLAQGAFEDAAEQLIATMSAMTGVGQNIDIMV